LTSFVVRLCTFSTYSNWLHHSLWTSTVPLAGWYRSRHRELVAFDARSCNATQAFGRSAYSRHRCTSPTPISGTPGPPRSTAYLRDCAVFWQVREDESGATASVASTCVRVHWFGL